MSQAKANFSSTLSVCNGGVAQRAKIPSTPCAIPAPEDLIRQLDPSKTDLEILVAWPIVRSVEVVTSVVSPADQRRLNSPLLRTVVREGALITAWGHPTDSRCL